MESDPEAMITTQPCTLPVWFPWQKLPLFTLKPNAISDTLTVYGLFKLVRNELDTRQIGFNFFSFFHQLFHHEHVICVSLPLFFMFFSHQLKTSCRQKKNEMVKHARPDTHQHIGLVCLRRELKGICFAVTTFWGIFLFFFLQNDKDTNLVFFFSFQCFSLIQCHSEKFIIIRMMMMKVITAVQRCRWISEGTGLQEEKETKFSVFRSRDVQRTHTLTH